MKSLLTDKEVLEALTKSLEPRWALDIYTNAPWPVARRLLLKECHRLAVGFDVADDDTLIINCDREIFEDVWHVLKEEGIGITAIV